MCHISSFHFGENCMFLAIMFPGEPATVKYDFWDTVALIIRKLAKHGVPAMIIGVPGSKWKTVGQLHELLAEKVFVQTFILSLWRVAAQ